MWYHGIKIRQIEQPGDPVARFHVHLCFVAKRTGYICVLENLLSESRGHHAADNEKALLQSRKHKTNRSINQSIIMRLGRASPGTLELNSVDFSSSSDLRRVIICGLRPLLKLAVHTMAFAMVAIIKRIVITAKKVSDRRAGRYSLNFEGWYIRTSLKRK